MAKKISKKEYHEKVAILGRLSEKYKIIGERIAELKAEIKEASLDSGVYEGYKLSVVNKEIYKLKPDAMEIAKSIPTLEPHLKKLVTKISVFDESALKQLLEDGEVTQRVAKKFYDVTEQTALSIKKDEEAR